MKVGDVVKISTSCYIFSFEDQRIQSCASLYGVIVKKFTKPGLFPGKYLVMLYVIETNKLADVGPGATPEECATLLFYEHELAKLEVLDLTEVEEG